MTIEGPNDTPPSTTVDAARLRDRLARFPKVLEALAATVDAADLRWRPAPEHWSVLEVLCHLRDEEREDFRPRLESTLHDPSAAWPKLDLAEIAARRRYNEDDPAAVLAAFAGARAANIAWLDATLPAADLTRAFAHPKFGPLHAGMLLASWAAHDALHLRQLARRLHDLARRDAGPYTVAYAGEW
ncbi:MAG: hypothetical protein RI967_2648 [Planctomycetota bacterium]